MEQQLQLTSRGYAVCELMFNDGLTLEAACERVEHELATLRRAIERIMTERTWEEVSAAMQAALSGFSLYLQGAYLEEQRRAATASDGAALSA